jgi:hypothetical protein
MLVLSWNRNALTRGSCETILRAVASPYTSTIACAAAWMAGAVCHVGDCREGEWLVGVE